MKERGREGERVDEEEVEWSEGGRERMRWRWSEGGIEEG
jgi:hypothetical protein